MTLELTGLSDILCIPGSLRIVLESLVIYVYCYNYVTFKHDHLYKTMNIDHQCTTQSMNSINILSNDPILPLLNPLKITITITIYCCIFNKRCILTLFTNIHTHIILSLHTLLYYHDNVMKYDKHVNELLSQHIPLTSNKVINNHHCLMIINQSTNTYRSSHTPKRSLVHHIIHTGPNTRFSLKQ